MQGQKQGLGPITESGGAGPSCSQRAGVGSPSDAHPGGEVSGLLTPRLWSQAAQFRPFPVVLETRAPGLARSHRLDLAAAPKAGGGWGWGWPLGRAPDGLEHSGHTPSGRPGPGGPWGSGLGLQARPTHAFLLSPGVPGAVCRGPRGYEGAGTVLTLAGQCSQECWGQCTVCHRRGTWESQKSWALRELGCQCARRVPRGPLGRVERMVPLQVQGCRAGVGRAPECFGPAGTNGGGASLG